MHDQSKVARGRWGEARAAAHLERCGFRVVDRGWRSPERHLRGDLDLVAVGSTDRLLVFCEVKARRAAASFGGAAAAVDQAKQARIRTLAESWLRTRGAEIGLDAVESMRFDVIAIDGVRLTHVEAAF